ncbi:GPW/gp25 family protein [Nannocystaceae bacterium ST9]
MAMSFPYRIDRTGRTAQPRDQAAHVRELIEQVLSTVPGERVGWPHFGTAVRELTFAPIGEQLLTATQHLVRGALQQWLAAWIEILDVAVEANESTLLVTIRYRHVGEREPRTGVFPIT